MLLIHLTFTVITLVFNEFIWHVNIACTFKCIPVQISVNWCPELKYSLSLSLTIFFFKANHTFVKGLSSSTVFTWHMQAQALVIITSTMDGNIMYKSNLGIYGYRSSAVTSKGISPEHHRTSVTSYCQIMGKMSVLNICIQWVFSVYCSPQIACEHLWRI